ncbi:hypothetical protein NC651_026209 [Populus alba x Populus x berolinensis]|nr:hypothetical protein NC651_026209 [Populus alba x Populus x berolinensis]
MDSEMIQDTPYTAAMNGNWESMYLFSRVTLSLDTGFHLAVHSNVEQPLTDLLGIMEEREFFLPETRNKFGNTVLHEATIYGNYEAVRLLVERCPDLLWIRNEVGETPLFTAAAFGEAEMVEFLIRSKPEQCVDDNGHLLSIHRQRWKDGLSILGAAIIGQHFGLPVICHHEVKLQLETRDQAGQGVRDLESGLGSCLERNQRGGLLNYLKVPKGLPVRRKVKFQVETSGQARKGTVGDVESGWGSSLERKPRGGLLNYFKVPKAKGESTYLYYILIIVSLYKPNKQHTDPNLLFLSEKGIKGIVFGTIEARSFGFKARSYYILSYLCISILKFHGSNKYLNTVANVSLNIIDSLSLPLSFSKEDLMDLGYTNRVVTPNF